jgi:hypothetical protein
VVLGNDEVRIKTITDPTETNYLHTEAVMPRLNAVFFSNLYGFGGHHSE